MWVVGMELKGTGGDEGVTDGGSGDLRMGD